MAVLQVSRERLEAPIVVYLVTGRYRGPTGLDVTGVTQPEEHLQLAGHVICILLVPRTPQEHVHLLPAGWPPLGHFLRINDPLGRESRVRHTFRAAGYHPNENVRETVLGLVNS